MSLLSGVAVARPTSLAEARDALLDPGRERTVLIRGAGTKLDWGAPARDVGLVVETTGLDRLLGHDAADATATVQAGMRLADLQARLAGAGQWLAIDPPEGGATVGGVFAANATGPRRLRYGAMRDLVIGMTMVTSDGAVARSGGRVIKNVAGYDLAKLLCGSLGTLGLVAELVVRLHPLPAASATVTSQVDPAVATRVALALMDSPLVVSAIDWSAGTMAVRIEGRRAGVDQQARGVGDLFTAHDAHPELVEADDEAALWQRMADARAGATRDTVAAAATLPAAFTQAAAAFDRACAEAGVEGVLSSHLGSGVHTGCLRGDDAAGHAAAVTAWRRRVEALGGHVTVRRRHDALVDADVIWGPAPSAVAVMRLVKERFDPAGRCAPGRFVGGI